MDSVHQYYFRKDSPEKVIQVIRQHVIILIANLSFGIAMLVVGLIGVDALSRVQLPSQIPSSAVFAVEAVYFVIAALLLYMGWFIYSRTEVIITEKHLVDVTQRSLFSRNVSQLEISKVQDVTDERHGILQTMLGYGAVIVQTAAEEDFFRLENLPNPDKIAEEFVSLFPKWPQAAQSLGGSVPHPTEQTDSTSQKTEE